MIARLLRWYFDRTDPTAIMQTPVPKFTGYDPTVQAKARARQQQQLVKSKPKANRSATVLPMRKQA